LEKFIFPIRNATSDLVLSYFAALGSNVNHEWLGFKFKFLANVKHSSLLCKNIYQDAVFITTAVKLRARKQKKFGEIYFSDSKCHL
jgi:hypothetical protein